MKTDELSARAATLSPEKLALLALRRRQKAAAAAPAGRISRRTAAGPAPLSFAQQRLWLLDLIEPGSTAYNMLCPARLTGELNLAALARACGEIVRRHEALRTIFRAVDGMPVQVVTPPGPSPLCVADLSGLPEPARRRESRRLLVEEAKRPFDLERSCLRMVLVQMDGTEHLLLLDTHHIVSDGWSFGVLFRELSALYDACCAGGPSPLPELPIQLADFAVWQRNWLQGDVLEEQLGYWRQQLLGSPPALELPTDRLRPAVQTHRGGLLHYELPRDLADRLRELSRREGASLFMTLLAGFDLLLSRLSGQEDVVVGSPSAGRGRLEVEGLIGMLLNTLVLRADLSGDPSFRELLARVRETVFGAYQYQDLPFEKLIEELQPERQLSRTPIFQVMFNFVSVPDISFTLSGVEIEMLSLPEPDAKFDFTLYVEDTPASLHLRLVYNADLFDRPRMQEMLRQLDGLLAQAVADPEAPIGSLSLVTPAATAVLPDPTLPLSGEWRGAAHQALSRHAARAPERLAIADGYGEVWTYGELEARSNQLARRLLDTGVDRGDAVAVWAHRNASLVWAILGTLKAGAAFVILDPTYPASRLLDYLEIARPSGWLAVEGAPAPPPEVEKAVSRLCRCRIALPPRAQAERQGFLADLSGTGPEIPIGPDDAACITFTSGSTGMPKGVVGRHGPLTHFYPRMGERFGLGEDDRFGMLSALSHDPLQRDVLTPLWFGASLAVPDPDGIGRLEYLADWVRRQEVSVLHLTPAMMELLIDSAGEDPAGGLPALRLAFVVGDLLKKADVESFQRLAPALTCVNLYGSTETQRSVSFFVVPRPEEPDAARRGREVLPLGSGMEGVQLLVLNRAGRLAGIGEAGEIHVRSRHLAQGYLGDDALTAERFLPNPSSSEAGDRIYRTGDLGRYLPEGGVEFAGRTDHQVKLRGFRIETGEVEAALARFPGIQECVAVVREDRRPGDRQLVAYLVTADAGPRTRELRAFLGERLPEYMIPSGFVILPALPLTRTGKVDRRALPPPAAERNEDETAARGPAEELLAGIWVCLLGVERVGPSDNFFELGGHSLLATRMASRVRNVLGVEMPIRAIFEEPTLAGFASLVARAQRDQAGLAQVPPLAPAPRDADLPLSFSQQRLWFLDQLEPESFAYNLSGALRLAGSLDIAALGWVLDEMVRRHEPLRTTFADGENGPSQVVAPPAPFPLPVVDLATLSPVARDAEAAQIAAAEAKRLFDLRRGPLLRMTLLRLAEREHALVTVMHHIVSDGWSLGILVRELSALYRVFVTGKPSPLAELPIQYADFAVWQRRWLSGQVLDSMLAWWTRQLAGAPPVLELPLDRPRPAVRSYRGARVSLPLGRDLEEGLEAVARRLAVTPFMVLLGGFALLLSRYSGQTDIVVGTSVAGRGHAELESLIGFFANTLALRTDLDGDPRFEELNRRVREAALGAYARQEVPFERLVEELRPERDLSHSPVFQVMLILQNLPAATLELPNLTLSPIEIESGRAQFDLTLTVYPGGNGPLARLEHSTELFDAATADRLLAHLRHLLAGIVDDPARRISELPLLAPEERRELLAAGEGAVSAPPEILVHQLFEAAVSRRPDALAVRGDGKSLTYRELNARANRLAHHLRRLGVGPDHLVAVCVERSPALLVAMLGVLKAGGAYVPLDPTYPADRLAWVLEDSRAAVLVTERGLAAALPPHAAHILALDAVDLFGESAADPLPLTAPENLAYVIYTSGSTGRPKGVAVRQRGAANFLASMARQPGLGPEDAVLAVTTIAFDIHVLELLLPLAVGARIELVDREVAADGLRLAARIADSAATVMQATPATWRLLLEAGWPGGPGLKVLCGGEALPADLARELLALVAELWNVYGPTETTVWSAVHAVSPADADGHRPVPIGGPIANTAIHLLGPFAAGLEPVPSGAAGELYIGGEGLARGYLGRPDLTAERFVPDPFSGRPGARLYRTGDLVRRRPRDRALEFLGRADHQIKIRGFRIELGEIEAVLGAQPAVRECAVVVREDVPGTKRLAAYLALDNGPAPAGVLAGLRAVLSEKLPEYMMPHLLLPLPALPLTPNGKIDRRALLAQPAPEAASVEEHVAPRDAAEEALAAVWAEVLHLERVGIHDNFFALGGDSILAIQVVTRSRKRGVRFAPRQIFQNQTIAQLAAVAEVAHPPGAAAGKAAATGPSIANTMAGPGSSLPTYFPEAGLSQQDLESLLAELAE